jgi:cell division protease FtsH
MIRSSYDLAYKIITENKETMEKIVEKLLKKETLSGEEFAKFFTKPTPKKLPGKK